MMENGQGEERKVNGKRLRRSWWQMERGAEAKSWWKMDGSLTYILFMEPLNVP
jgi:hypothetical protein